MTARPLPKKLPRLRLTVTLAALCLALLSGTAEAPRAQTGPDVGSDVGPDGAGADSTSADLHAGAAPLRASFDSGRGQLWLMPHSQGRRVGTGFVLDQGAALWSHPGAAATLSTAEVELRLEHGGLVGLQRTPGAETTVDLYLGQGSATLGRADQRALVPGVRWHVAQGSVTESIAATPLGTYGAAPFEAPLADSGEFPRGLVGVVQLALPGQREPLRLDPRELELDIDLSGLSAEIRTRQRFELDAAQGVPCCEPLLGVYEALLPDGALLRGIELEVGGERHFGEATSLPPSLRPTLAAVIESTDPAAGIAERVPFGLWPLDPDKPEIVVELHWTQPLRLAHDGAALHIPAVGDLSATTLERFAVTVRGTDGAELAASHALEPRDGTLHHEAQDVTPSAGFALLLPQPEATLAAPRAWAGRTPGLDGVYFAVEQPLESTPPDAQGTDTIVVVDHSASLDPQAARHLHDATLALAGGLVDPTRDRLLVLRLSRELEPLTTGFEHVDDRVLAALRSGLASQPRGTTDVVAALDRVLAEARGRDDASGRALQVIFLGELRPTGLDPAALDERLEALASLDASLAVIDLTTGDNPALESVLGTWSFATLAAAPSTAGTLTTARLATLLGHRLTRTRPLRPASSAVEEYIVATDTARFGGATRLITGIYQSPGPLFDIPGRLQLCDASSATSDCSDPVLDLDLAKAHTDRGLGVLHTARVLRTAPMTATFEAADTLGLLHGDHHLGLPELRASFDLELLERRERGAVEIHWLRYESALRTPTGGRADRVAVTPLLPDASGASGNSVSAASLPFERDPWLQTTRSTPPPPPTMAEVLSGQRLGAASTNTAVAWTEPTPGTVEYAIYYAKPWTESALATTRSTIFGQLTADPVKAQHYLEAWHEVALGSTTQLYTVQSHYYTLSLYDQATLAAYDISAIEPWVAEPQRKDAIRFFLDRKLWPRAERLLRPGFENNPEDRFYADGLVQLYEATGRKDEVARIEIEALERQLARNPERAALLDTLLGRLVRAGRADAARRAVDTWAERTGRSPTFFGLKARLALLDGRKDDAIDLLKEGVDTFPRARYARALLVDGLVEAGREADAVEAAEDWLAIDPDNAYLLQLIGDLHIRMGQSARARDVYERLVELAPEAALGYVKLGDALSALDLLEDSAAAYSHALRLAPGDLAANLRVIDATTRTGNFEAAVEAFERIRQMGGMASGPDGGRSRDELFYELLLRWRTEAIWSGDDALLARINEKLRAVYVDFGLLNYNATSPAYALRVAFVPDTQAADVLIDVRITEPGGNVISYISPYNTALGSQLASGMGRAGPGPRVYFLPQTSDGTFRLELGHGGPPEHGPLRGRLFVHTLPRPFTEYWSQHDVVLERPGDLWTHEIVIDALPQGDVVAPEGAR